MTTDYYGRMWIGTTRGLFSFDGTDFSPVNSADTISVNVTSLFCDSIYIWIGFDDGTIGHRSIKTWKNDFVVDTSYGASVSRIIEEPSGRIWIATYGNGLFVRDKKFRRHITLNDGLPGNEIYAMTVAKDGTVWLGTDGGLTQCNFVGGKFILNTYTPKDGLPDEIVRCLESDQSGNIWIGMQDEGVCYFNPQNKIFTVPPFSHHWNHGAVSALSIQGYNRLMVGTMGKGLISVSMHDSYHPLIYDQSTGYENVKISDIQQDNEGNFWIISVNRGLDQFPALFEWMSLKKPFNTEAISVVMHDNQSYLWFSTLKGLFKMNCDSGGNDIVTPVRLLESEKQPVITSLYQDVKGNIWIGTFNSGVFVNPFHSIYFLQFTQQDQLANDNVLSITGNKDNVWISTLGGVTQCRMKALLNKKIDFSFQNFTEGSGLNSNYIYQTFIDSKGRIWFATDGGGLKMMHEKIFVTYEEFDTLKIKTIYSITEGLDGTIWFSTPSNGIFKFDGKKFTNYGLKEGISDLAISGILTDENGDIVILENDAIDILETKTNQVRSYRGKSVFDDISPNLNSYNKDQFSNIWIATKHGILKYYTPSLLFSHESRIEIREVLVELAPIDFEKLHIINYNQNHVTFNFHSFWNSNPSQVIYRYMLQGHDLDWIKTKDERAIYPELPPGTYTFNVQATIHRNFEDASTGLYTFTITPPFWKTWWFIAACSVLVASLIYFFIKERDKRRAREEKLSRERIEFQLENLKTQINPHFLFNSFNTLATLVEENTKTALVYIDHLSDFFRSLLAFKDVDLVTLKDELDLTNDYIFLLQQRHGEKLQVEKTVSKVSINLKIPPLTLQLLIENAVKHNVVSKDQPLKVEIFTIDDRKICVRNNLQKKKVTVSTKFGLQNIRKRCELLGSKEFETEENKDYFLVCVPLFKN